METKKKKIRCPKCTNYFSSKDELKLHIETSCSECKTCKHWFKSPSAVVTHVSQGKCKPLICEICGIVLTRKVHLKSHMISHTDVKPFSCSQCDYKCKTEAEMKKHYVRVHKVHYIISRVACKNCKLKCATQEILDQHIQKDCKQCHKCEKWYASEDDLNNHTCKPRVCPKCGKRFKYPAYLTDHLTTHDSDNEVKCTYCNKTFLKKRLLEAHIKKVHEIEFKRDQVSCDNCKKVCISSKDLEQHMENECRFCSRCSTTFKTAQDLKNHNCVPTSTRKRKRENSTSPPTSVVDKVGFEKLDRPYKCNFCKKTYTTTMNLLMHIRMYHDINYTENAVKCDKCFKVYYFKEELTKHQKEECTMCKRCERWFPNPDALITHQKSRACTVKKCNKCGKICQDKHHLAIHMRKHTQDKPFKCEFCKVKCGYPSSLLRHLKKQHPNEYKKKQIKCIQCKNIFSSLEVLVQHTKNECMQCLDCETYYPSKKQYNKHTCRPRKCKICGRRFKFPVGLDAHMRTHTNDRQFKCNYCDSKFKHPANLTTHKERFHRYKDGKPLESILWKCHHCEAEFTSREDFKKHMMNHLRCKCGLKFKGMGQMRIHLSWCGQKCIYCGVGFFSGLKEYKQHHKFCKQRHDFNCTHCKTLFNRKNLYFEHIRKYCSRRPLLFKCDCCNALQDCGITNATEALEHYIKCRPKGPRKTYECFICERRFTKEIISLHIQQEILHSRLFDRIPCNYQCIPCKISYPTEELLQLHYQLDHTCRNVVVNEWNKDPGDLENMSMPADMKVLLQSERARIREMNLEDFEFNGELPLHKCYLCLQPYHSEFLLRVHVSKCEKYYRVQPSNDSSKLPMSNVLETRNTKERQLLRKWNADVARKLLKRLQFDVDCNVRISESYWNKLEKEFHIYPGYAKKWLPDIIRGEELLERHFNDFLSDDCVVLPYVPKKAKDIEIVDLTDEVDEPVNPSPTTAITYKCRTCGLVCSTNKDLRAHRFDPSHYLRRKFNAQLQPIRKKPKGAVDVGPTPTDYEDLELWRFKDTLPTFRCELCRHPFHSEFSYQAHVIKCEKKYEPPLHD